MYIGFVNKCIVCFAQLEVHPTNPIMRNLYLGFTVVFVLFLALITIGSSGGRATAANAGNTGAPSASGGTETTCSQCHSNGNFGEPAITFTIADMLGGPAITEYVPGQTYQVTAVVSETGANTPAAYGFQSVFLSVPENETIPVQAGTLGNGSEGTETTTLDSGRTYAEHGERSSTGEWTFEWTAPAAGTGEVKAYVVGNLVNTNFSTSGDNGSTMPTIITLSEMVILPLELNYFSGSANKNQVGLNWETASEEAFSHFNIERRTAASTWETIGTVTGVGGADLKATYRFEDINAANGVNHYRLRMEDLDGTYEYSNLITVTTATNALSVYPNPATDFVHVRAADEAPVTIINAAGKTVARGFTNQPIQLSHLPVGIYYLSSPHAGEQSFHRIIKQ